MPSSSQAQNRPLWTRLLATLPDTHASPPLSHLTSVLALLAPSIANMGMPPTFSHPDLVTLGASSPVAADSGAGSASDAAAGAPPLRGPGPTLVFGSTLKSCAVCLEDYRAGDHLRLLDACGHCFHVSCVDEWFNTPRSGSANSRYFQCPVCNTPVSYPYLAAPKAARHVDVDSGRTGAMTTTATTTTTSEEEARRQRWAANVQLIDLSVHQSWVEWFTELLRVYSISGRNPPQQH